MPVYVPLALAVSRNLKGIEVLLVVLTHFCIREARVQANTLAFNLKVLLYYY